MSRAEILMNDVRENSNVSKERWSNFKLMKLFNDSQEVIRSIIHTSDGTGKFFPKTVSYDLAAGNRFYDLPADCYAFNSINNIQIQTDTSLFLNSGKLRQILASESNVSYGYYPFGRQIRLSFTPVSGGKLIINYAVKLPTISPRVMEINSYSEGKIRPKRGSFDQDIDISLYADNVSIVDRKGNIHFSDLEIGSYSTSSGTLSLTGDFPTDDEVPTIERGQFVVLGEMASTHTRLPSEVHNFLTTMVERRIKAIDTEVSFQSANYITDVEEAHVRSLFSQSENDTVSTPLAEDNYLAY